MRNTRLGPADVYALTGITAAEVDRITTITNPSQRRGRPPGLTHPDRVLLTLVALRTNLTERALAAIFDISQPTAHRIIRDLTAAIAGLFVPDQFDDTAGLRCRSAHDRRKSNVAVDLRASQREAQRSALGGASQ